MYNRSRGFDYWILVLYFCVQTIVTWLLLGKTWTTHVSVWDAIFSTASSAIFIWCLTDLSNRGRS